jgi:hypothetical protein
MYPIDALRYNVTSPLKLVARNHLLLRLLANGSLRLNLNAHVLSLLSYCRSD